MKNLILSLVKGLGPKAEAWLAAQLLRRMRNRSAYWDHQTKESVDHTVEICFDVSKGGTGNVIR